MIVGHIGGGSVASYEIQKSLRFRANASAYLSRTPTVAGNRKTWTWSGWVKRGALANGNLFGAYVGSGTVDTNFFSLAFFGDKLQCNGWATVYFITNAIFRDPSAWYHIVLYVDTTQATASNRVLLWVNGQAVTSFSSSTAPTQNVTLVVNGAAPHYVGWTNQGYGYFDGYLSEINFIDGQALEPSYFGQVSAETGAWIPKKYTGTYGTNGFYLPFNDGANLTNLTADRSGNGNNWTANNFSLTPGVTYDWMDDTPTNNFAVLNPLHQAGVATPANGNLSVSQASNGAQVAGSFAMSSGKWFYEQTIVSVGGENSVGVGSAPSNGGYIGAFSGQYGYYPNGSKISNGGSSVAYGASYTDGDIIGVAYDADAGNLTFYKNGVSQGVAFTGITGTLFALAATRSAGGQNSSTFNFGQRPFQYTQPTGFKALCTKNLPTPSITNPKKHFDVAIYTTNGSPQTITTDGLGNALRFAPNFLWNKGRNLVQSHYLANTITGLGNTLNTDTTLAEAATGFYTAVSDGSFSVGSDTAGRTKVNWLWKAGGAPVANNAGSITSTVSANTAAGFSIVTYTGTGANATVGHGLGVVPRMVIVKQRNAVRFWPVYHAGAQIAPATGQAYLNTTNAYFAESTTWNNTAPTSSVFNVGTNAETNANTGTYVAYCFAEIPGYSKIGSYTGNGSADGPFVWCGFKPAFVMVKRSDSAGTWYLVDNKRNGTNSVQGLLYPNLSNAEATINWDILSNGFKMRDSGADLNASGGTYIFIAFAEAPFQFANAR